MTLWIGALALGLAFACMALGVYLTFRVLAFPDLTVDGSLPLGAAVAAMLMVDHGWQPWLTLPVAFAAGALGGVATGLLHTRFGINGLLSGILVSFGLWTVNLRVMGERANVPLLGVDTLITPFRSPFVDAAAQLRVNAGDLAAVSIFCVIACCAAMAMNWFLKTELGLALRATGDNRRMARALGVNPSATLLLGLALSNALVGLSGALVAQYQGFADVGIGLGMIIAGLASVIIGQTLFRSRGVLSAVLSVVAGSVLYRLIIALALLIGLGPTDMKLVTSVIVIAALALPGLRKGSGQRELQTA